MFVSLVSSTDFLWCANRTSFSIAVDKKSPLIHICTDIVAFWILFLDIISKFETYVSITTVSIALIKRLIW